MWLHLILYALEKTKTFPIPLTFRGGLYIHTDVIHELYELLVYMLDPFLW
jgi:hypothetical protein